MRPLRTDLRTSFPKTAIVLASTALILSACGGSSSSSNGSDSPIFTAPSPTVAPTQTPVPTQTPTPEPTPAVAQQIKVNQLGFMPQQSKTAVVPDNGSTSFTVVSQDDGSEVLSGTLTSAATWDVTGESTRRADFSTLTTDGTYVLKVDGLPDSPAFDINSDIYQDLISESIRAYYRQRASTAIEAQYESVYPRVAGHPDTKVLVHSSAATDARPENTEISSPGGWYDAGDYGKYVVNSGITVYTLMLAFEQYPSVFTSRDLNIPESTNTTPDLLDEIRWNLDWMLTMQDLDGGVYHKLTSLNFSRTDTSPERHTAARYVIGKSVTASLNLAATLAFASRVYEPYDANQAATYLAAAKNAWTWAVANPDATFTENPPGVGTGQYDDRDPIDEFAWAAVELFNATGEQQYEDAYSSRIDRINKFETPGWQGVDALALISATAFAQDSMDDALYLKSRQLLLDAASAIKTKTDNNPYQVPIYKGLFYWGSNSNALYNGMVLMQAAIETDSKAYVDAAAASLDYVLGRNATDYSFVTGFGDKTPKDIHHRPSTADNIDEPYPGLLVGGPNNRNNEEGCDYPRTEAATAYVDLECSFSTNEIAINWNAPLVYLSAAITSEYESLAK